LLTIIATDANPVMLDRCRAGRYSRGSLKELPQDWIDKAFDESGDDLQIRDEYRQQVQFEQQDIRADMPAGPFDLILFRNQVFTYFDEASQWETLPKLVTRMQPGGRLITGRHERLPEGHGLVEDRSGLGIYRTGCGTN
jgi:chemotaxis protein methyltransferase CheR